MSSIANSSATVAHSAQVDIRLEAEGRSLEISQLGPDFFITDADVRMDPTRGDIVMTIDGNQRRWSVYLPEGLDPSVERVPIRRA